MIRTKGYTLIELLAVIMILAIVGVIAIPLVAKNIENSRVKSYKTSVQNVMEAAKEYEIEVKVKNKNAESEDQQYKEKEELHTTKTIVVTTESVEKPTFKITGSSYASSKEVTITYPLIEGGKNYYKVEDIAGNKKAKSERIEKADSVAPAFNINTTKISLSGSTINKK